MSGWKKYKRMLSDMLPCQKQERDHILEEVRQGLGDKAPSLSYEELLEKLGLPEEVAASYIQGMEPREVAQAMKTRNHVFRLLAVLVGCVILVWAICMTFAVIDSKHHRGHLVIDPAVDVERIID
jgi:hypothetical protein